jgi:hypothetical protein
MIGHGHYASGIGVMSGRLPCTKKKAGPRSPAKERTAAPEKRGEKQDRHRRFSRPCMPTRGRLTAK